MRSSPFPVTSFLINRLLFIKDSFFQRSTWALKLIPTTSNETSREIGFHQPATSLKARRGLIKYLTVRKKGPRKSRLRPLQVLLVSFIPMDEAAFLLCLSSRGSTCLKFPFPAGRHLDGSCGFVRTTERSAHLEIRGSWRIRLNGTTRLVNRDLVNSFPYFYVDDVHRFGERTFFKKLWPETVVGINWYDRLLSCLERLQYDFNGWQLVRSV